MSNDGELRKAQEAVGILPPMDQVVKWRLAECADFDKYRAEHRGVFSDMVSRVCRSNRMSRSMVKGMMGWIRVIADQEIRVRALEAFVEAYRHNTASAITGKPVERKPKKKRKKASKKKAKPAVRVDVARNEEMRERGEDVLQKLAAKEEAKAVKETPAVGEADGQ